jgi:hypothetical protein
LTQDLRFGKGTKRVQQDESRIFEAGPRCAELEQQRDAGNVGDEEFDAHRKRPMVKRRRGTLLGHKSRGQRMKLPRRNRLGSGHLLGG